LHESDTSPKLPAVAVAATAPKAKTPKSKSPRRILGDRSNAALPQMAGKAKTPTKKAKSKGVTFRSPEPPAESELENMLSPMLSPFSQVRATLVIRYA